MKGKLVASLVTTFVVVFGSLGYLATGARPNLGLDLQGGISAILSPVVEPGQTVDSEVLDRTIDVIRDRVDALGVAEPDISRQGTDVLIQLPGLRDEERAREIIGRTARLEFRSVEQIRNPGAPGYDDTPPCDELIEERLAEDDEGILCGNVEDLAPLFDPETGEPVVDEETGEPVLARTKYVVGPAALTGNDVDDARPVPSAGSADPLGGGGAWSTQLELTRTGGTAFAEITSELACARDRGEPGLLAIVLDHVVESAPGMRETVACGVGITGGSALIDTRGGQDDARDLALVLRTGALPITLEPSTFETVSATLGADSLRAGLLAGLIGLSLVTVYLIFFYRWLGVVAIGALAIFGVLMLGIITLLGEVGFSLTLAGIAGIIVAIGITADSSIIYFERLRDEAASGRTMRTSVKRAFQSAFRTNLAGNTVTAAAAVVLYFIAVGPVRGFALMLGIATVLDLLIMYFYTRPAVALMGNTRLLSRRSVRAAEPVPAGGER